MQPILEVTIQLHHDDAGRVEDERLRHVIRKNCARPVEDASELIQITRDYYVLGVTRPSPSRKIGMILKYYIYS